MHEQQRVGGESRGARARRAREPVPLPEGPDAPCPFAPSEQVLERLCGIAFSDARFPMTVLDGSFRFARVNQSFAALIDHDAEELIGRPVGDVTHEDDIDAGNAAARAIAAGQGPQAFEKRYLRRDGRIVRVETLVDLICDDEGKPSCYLAQMRDVTEERIAAERLRRLVRLHAVLASTNEAVLHAETAAELFEAACRIAVDHGGFRLAWIGRVDQESKRIQPLVANGPGKPYLMGIELSAADMPAGRGPTGRAVRLRKPQVCDDVASNPAMAPWRDGALAMGFASCAAFPLVIDGDVRGVLSVYSGEISYFDEEVIGLLERLVANVSFGWQTLEHDEQRRSSLAELEAQTRRLRQRFERTSVASLTVDLEGRITDANAALATLVQRPIERLVGSVAAALFEGLNGASRLLGLGASELDDDRLGPVEVVERRLRRADGAVLLVVVSSTLVRDTVGDGLELYLQLQDITNRRSAEALAARRQAQQAALAELGRAALGDEPLESLFARTVSLVARHATVEIVELLELDPVAGRLVRKAATGFDASLLEEHREPVPLSGSLAGRALDENKPVVAPELSQIPGFRVSSLLRAHGVRSSAAVVVGSGGMRFGVLEAHSTTPRGFEEEEIPFFEGVAHVVGAAIARRRAETELGRRALYDALTGLPNRALLLQRLELATVLSGEAEEVGVLFVDLDRFKLVNDSLGHGAGDELLRVCSERVLGCVRERDTVARFGGDEMVVVCETAGGPNGALELAERVLSAIARPVTIDRHELTPSASIGVVVGNRDSAPSDLLRNADIAMYQAKASGGSCAVLFDAAMRASLQDRLELEADLRHALERDELFIHYQPIVDLASGALVGAEALVRWCHPERGIVEPDAFVPLAEETGLIVPLGVKVLSLVCDDLARWSKDERLDGFVAAINVSARQLRAPAFASIVAEALALRGLAPDLLCIEITESVLMEDSEATLTVLEELKTLGVRLSVDDFGTGYSSLAYLKRFPIDELKVDRSFMAELEDTDSEAAIVTGVVQLARALGLAVVAEGVETSTQLGHLRLLGCDRAQGYLLSLPMLGIELEEQWLHRRPL